MYEFMCIPVDTIICDFTLNYWKIMLCLFHFNLTLKKLQYYFSKKDQFQNVLSAIHKLCMFSIKVFLIGNDRNLTIRDVFLKLWRMIQREEAQEYLCVWFSRLRNDSLRGVKVEVMPMFKVLDLALSFMSAIVKSVFHIFLFFKYILCDSVSREKDFLSLFEIIVRPVVLSISALKFFGVCDQN